MKVLRINWLTCDTCKRNNIEVETEKGNESWLYAGDEAKCLDCGAIGEINDDGETAWFESEVYTS